MNDIEKLRKEITKVDAQIISLVAKRQAIAKKVGEYKKEHNLPISDLNREILLREYHNAISVSNGLSPAMVNNIFNILLEESRKVQIDEQ